MRRIVAVLVMLCVLCAIGTAACSRRSAEPLAFRPGEATADGLRQVEGPEGLQVFLKPGTQLEDFTQILVDPFSVSYASSGPATEELVRTLDADTEARLTEILRSTFMAEIDRSREFDLVEQPGPKALRVQGWLYDLVVEEPPSEDHRNFPLCFADWTVILTVRHSETAEALARGRARINLSCSDDRGGFKRAEWRDVTEAVKPWGRALRRWLERLRERPPGEA
jgi:hypothetical protein